jgi:hypothetical protein
MNPHTSAQPAAAVIAAGGGPLPWLETTLESGWVTAWVRVTQASYCALSAHRKVAIVAAMPSANVSASTT